jgi:hypothetical protein
LGPALIPGTSRTSTERLLAKAAAAAALLVPACRRGAEAEREFQVRQFWQAGAQAVRLNERLYFWFTAPVDPASVTSRSIAVRADDGSEARGRFETGGNQVTFTPDPVLARTLDDGGLRPGVRYRVEIAGFPRPDALRSIEGEILSPGARYEFRTVAPAEGVLAFEDVSPLKGPQVLVPLPPDRLTIRGGGPVRFALDEPLRPDSVTEESVRLQAYGTRAGAGPVPVRTRVRLLENDPSAVVEVEPLDPVEGRPGAAYLVDLAETLRDFGGNPRPPQQRAFIVEFDLEGSEGEQVLDWDFATIAEREENDVGEDGWAAWTGDGIVEARIPALAGKGENGPLVVEEPRLLVAGEIPSPGDPTPPLRDFSFTEIVLRPEGELRIEGEGLVVLRSASVVHVEGRVQRFGPGPAGAGFTPFRAPERALEGLAEEGGTALALVSAGNLVVEGDLFSEGTLLLVAGGRVVVETGASVRADRILVSGSGPPLLRGEVHPEPERIEAPQPVARYALPRPLVYSCSSRWHPLGGKEVLRATVVGGGVEVRFHGARARDDAPTRPDPATDSGPVEDPALLSGSSFVRLAIRIRLASGEGGGPERPFLDAVRLHVRDPSR